jgi:hypothetical protein
MWLRCARLQILEEIQRLDLRWRQRALARRRGARSPQPPLMRSARARSQV